MQLPKYELKAGESLMVFEFISNGRKGKIVKLINFTPLVVPGFYNLAFGDKNAENDELDDLIVTDNGALHHPLRQKLLALIEAKGKISVSELYAKLKIEQSVASSHLAILRRANVVIAHRDGRKIFYTVNGKRISQVSKIAQQLAPAL